MVRGVWTKNEMARVKREKDQKVLPRSGIQSSKVGKAVWRCAGRGSSFEGKNRVTARLKHNFDGGFFVWFGFDLILMRSLKHH